MRVVNTLPVSAECLSDTSLFQLIVLFYVLDYLVVVLPPGFIAGLRGIDGGYGELCFSVAWFGWGCLVFQGFVWLPRFREVL